MFDPKSHWETIYRDKSALEVSWYQKEPRLSLELIERTGISKDATIIDVGGGASLLVDYLHNTGYTNLTVLDISASALDCARQRLAEQASMIDWIESDITAYRPSKTFALWHDRAVFHFLTDAVDRQKYVEVLKQSLQPNGHVIIAAFAIGGPDKCSGLNIVQYDANKLQAELGAGFELQEERSETHLTPDNKPQQFGYFRLIYTGS